MGRIWAIAINTFREAVRDKVLHGVLGFAGAVLLFTLALAELSLDQQRRVVLDVGMASISLFSVVVAVFLGSSLLYKEIERKTLYVILPKPIHRHELLIGKYLGTLVTAGVFVAIMGAIQLWVTAAQFGAEGTLLALFWPLALVLLGLGLWRARDRTAVVLPWSGLALAAAAALAAGAEAPVGPLLSQLALIGGEVLVLSAVALFFSSFSTPFLTGAFTFGVFLVGRGAHDLLEAQSSVIPDALRLGMRALGRVVPNLHLFYPGHHALTGGARLEGGLALYLGTTLGYGALYAAVLVGLAALIFRRRDLA